LPSTKIVLANRFNPSIFKPLDSGSRSLDSDARPLSHAEDYWLNQGVRGVPAMICKRRHLLTGAQGVENYRRILEQLAANQDRASA